MNGYLFWTYAPLSVQDIAAAEMELGLSIPAPLRSFYSYSNGARLLGCICIDGVPAQRTRSLDSPQPVDLLLSNILRPNGAFVFGSMTGWSASVKLGMWPNGQVFPVNEQTLEAIGSGWQTFDAFVFGEMSRLAALHDERGLFTGTYAQCLPTDATHLEVERPNGRPDYGMD
ncbi:MAG: SMI1/KNR4 family protein [Hyphomonadaceae bacterium]|nr:SMI1/KNR4 family protein [Hyphomonadaceae bacterium]